MVLFVSGFACGNLSLRMLNPFGEYSVETKLLAFCEVYRFPRNSIPGFVANCSLLSFCLATNKMLRFRILRVDGNDTAHKHESNRCTK